MTRADAVKGLRNVADWHYGKYEQTHEEDYLNDGDFLTAVAKMLKAQEPRVMTLEEAKEARICWIEERDVGIVYPAIYECIGNPSKSGQFSVFTVVPDADILPEEFDDDDNLVRTFEEGRRWLWEADHNDVWRCWTSRPTYEQREATPWERLN